MMRGSDRRKMKWDPISKYSKFSVLPELVPHPGEAQSCLCPGAQERWACTLLVTFWKAVSLHGDPVSCLCLSDVFLIIGGARAPNDCKVLFIQTEHGEKCIFVNAPIIPVPTRTKKNVFCLLPGMCYPDPLFVLSWK